MRKLFSALCALALFLGGAYIVYSQMFLTNETPRGLMAMGVMMFGIGAVWLWNDARDFIAGEPREQAD